LLTLGNLRGTVRGRRVLRLCWCGFTAMLWLGSVLLRRSSVLFTRRSRMFALLALRRRSLGPFRLRRLVLLRLHPRCQGGERQAEHGAFGDLTVNIHEIRSLRDKRPHL
jgi:hypothetical protein